MNHSEKLGFLRDLPENRLRQEIIIPLLRAMGYQDVVEYHGPAEKGKDIICYDEDRLKNRNYWSIVAKKGNLTGSASTDTGAMNVLNQVQQSFNEPYTDVYGFDEIRINRCIVIVSGNILDTTIESIKGTLRQTNLDRNLDFFDGERLVTYVDEYLPAVFWDEYDYFRKYFTAMKDDFETIKDVSALGQKEPIPLENLYVALRVCPKAEERKAIKELECRIYDEQPVEMRERQIEKLARARPLDADTAIHDNARLVILGPPGSGKTTLVKYLALTTCKKNLDARERLCVPIPVVFSKFAESGKAFREYIDDVFEHYGFPKAKDFVEKDLKTGKCLVLLDGFDELAVKERQDEAAMQVAAFVRSYPACRCVVTSRPTGYHDELHDFTTMELLEFDDEQIGRFIGNWFGVEEPEKAVAMLKAVKENEKVHALARNPLMVAIIAVIYEEDMILPQKRAELYKRCVEVLLSRWDKTKKLKNEYSSEHKEFILRKLAYYGHCNNKRIFTKDEILKQMNEYFKQCRLEEMDIEPFITEISQRSHLLRPIAADSYDFLHLSFQEYFTALELSKMHNGTSMIIEHLLAMEHWWEEPILLYAGIIDDATHLINEIKAKVPEDIFLDNLLLFGGLIAVTGFTNTTMREDVVNDLFDLYRIEDLSFLTTKIVETLAMVNPARLVEESINDLASGIVGRQIRSAIVLRRFREDSVIDKLRETLRKCSDHGVRISIVRTLGVIHDSRVADELIKILTDENEKYHVRTESAYALGTIGTPEAVKAIFQLIKEDNGLQIGIGSGISIALGRTGNEGLIEPLIEIMATHEYSIARFFAADTLGNMHKQIISADRYDNRHHEKVENALIEVLDKDKEFEVRWKAAEILGEIKGKNAVESLIKALKTDSDSTVRWKAAQALGYIGDQRAIEPLISAFKEDVNNIVRRNAADALGRFGSRDALKPLISILKNDPDPDNRWRVAEALSKIGGIEAIETLMDTVQNDKSEIVRRYSAIALGELDCKRAFQYLLDNLKKDNIGYVHERTIELLGRIDGQKAIESLVAMLLSDMDNADDSHIRICIIDALESIGHKQTMEPLKKILAESSKHPYSMVRNRAFEALYNISRRNHIRIPLKENRHLLWWGLEKGEEIHSLL